MVAEVWVWSSLHGLVEKNAITHQGHQNLCYLQCRGAPLLDKVSNASTQLNFSHGNLILVANASMQILHTFYKSIMLLHTHKPEELKLLFSAI